MFENIETTNPNFCIGPQIGTYCTVNYSADPVVMQVKNNVGTLIRNYSFNPDILQPSPYAYTGGPGDYVPGSTVSVKSVVIDIANNWGYSSYVGIRSIDFYDEDDNLITLDYSDFITYHTSQLSSSYPSKAIFNTGLSKTGTWSSTNYLSANLSITNQRIICVFNSNIDIKKIVINNSHSSGAATEAGVKDIKMYYYDQITTNVAYGADIDLYTSVFDGQIPKHVASNSIDSYEIPLSGNATAANTEFEKIKYVGPYNQSSYYDGAIFYTLERIGTGVRTYYTYERDPEPNGPFKTPLVTSSEVEYNGNIIRRWELDSINFRLDLKESFSINSDSSNWFDGQAFDVKTLKTDLSWHVSTGTGVIEVTSTSGISKYDRILIGPSNDTSNVGAVDYAYVHSVSGTELNLRTYGGLIPTEYEYVLGDSVTIYKDILLLSNSKPLINTSNIRYGYERDQGSLFVLDHSDYGSVKDVDYHGMYNDVIAAEWNNLFETFSFVHGQNLLHLNLLDYSVSKSQVLTLMDSNKTDYITLYDLCIDGTDVYRLQRALFQRDDSGNTTVTDWSFYNYTVDALTPYTQSVTVVPLNNVLGYQGISFVYTTVRDQFGVGLLGKNVEFSSSDDSGSSFIPSDGQAITDSNGYCIVRYTAGSTYKGNAEIKVSSDGGNTVNGSAYVVGFSFIPTLPNYIQDFYLMNVEEEVPTELNVMSTEDEHSIDIVIQCFVRRSSPGGEWVWNGSTGVIEDPSIEDRNREQNSVEKAFIYQIYLPIFSNLGPGGDDPPNAKITQFEIAPDPTVKITSLSEATDERNVSQNYLSRHLSSGHVVTSTINQYVFIQEARPIFWSVKNPTEIDYWIRLRPFSDSLDPATLEIHVREESYAGINDLGDIAPAGNITTFDAGGGLDGVEFQYNFPDKFRHNAIVYINLTIKDQAIIPNVLNVDYWFTIIADYRAPYVRNRVPDIEEIDVLIDTDITFDVLDEGEGVDITTLEVFINNQSISFNYVEYLPGQYHIECVLNGNFHYSEEVYVDIIVSDRSENKNTTRLGWGFYCIGSNGPWFNEEDVLPGKCLLGMGRDTNNIELQVYGINDTGIEYDSLRVEVGGKYRNMVITPIIYRLK